MMQIKCTGGTKNQKKYAKSIALFCAGKLMHRNLIDNISLQIKFSKTLYKDCGNLGNITWEDDNYKPREFVMEIDNTVRLRRVLESVAHEMVHLKQFAKGEMRDMMTADKTEWFGETLHSRSLDYYDLPWEIEAHGRECGLFVRWAEAHKLGKRRWTHDR